MTVRPEIVSLLLDWDAKHAKRKDGTPFTEAERELLGQASFEEVEAAKRYWQTAADYHQSMMDDYARLGELLSPAFDKLPESALAGDAIAAMPEPQRTETLAILDRLAPDGTIVISRPK